MTPFFKELFEYNTHFNQKLSEVFHSNPGKSSEKALKLFSHILNAHSIWNHRIEKKQSPFGVWEIQAVQDFKNIDQSNYQMSLQILENCELQDIVVYTNSNGQEFNNCIQDMLFHIINHSTYHRAQIATEFKQYGLEPIASDYIFFKRI